MSSLLDREQTLNLIEKAQKGDKEAKATLLKHNYPLIKSVIKRFLHKGIEYDDLYQLGCIGFLKAIKNFNAEFNVKFSTYCVPMVMGEVKRFMRDDGIIKVSRSLKTLNYKLTLFINSFRNEHDGALPTLEILEQNFDVDRQEILLALDCNLSPISLSEPIDTEGNICIEDRLEASKGEYDTEIYLMLKNEIKLMQDRDKKIVLLRYYRNKTQAEVAKMLGVSQVQVSRLEAKIIQKLKEKFNSN